MAKLTKKQALFIHYVEVDGMTQAEAYLKAYPKCKPANVHWAISQVMRKTSVIDFYEKTNKKLEKKIMLTKEKKEKVLNELVDIGMERVPAVDKAGLPMRNEKGEVVYTAVDATIVVKAINEDNRMKGEHAPVKQEVEQTSVDLTPAILKNLEKKHND